MSSILTATRYAAMSVQISRPDIETTRIAARGQGEPAADIAGVMFRRTCTMRWAMAESGRMRALMGPVCRCGQNLFDGLVRCLRYNRRIAVSPYRRIAVSPYRRNWWWFSELSSSLESSGSVGRYTRRLASPYNSGSSSRTVAATGGQLSASCSRQVRSLLTADPVAVNFTVGPKQMVGI